MPLLNPRTAHSTTSIFTSLSGPLFRRNLVFLEERCNAIPIPPQTFSASDWLESHQTRASHDDIEVRHTLSIEDEQKLADGFAFLSAVEEGAQSVAAVCIEEYPQHSVMSSAKSEVNIILRFAAMDSTLSSNFVTQALEKICTILTQFTLSSTSYENLLDTIFDAVVRLHRKRLLARLRSRKWKKPKFLAKSHKKALWADLENLRHRVQHCYEKGEKRVRANIESAIMGLEQVLKEFEGSDEELIDESTLDVDEARSIAAEKLVIQKANIFCTDQNMREYIQRLEQSIGIRPTAQISAAIKTFRQIEKIAAYERIPLLLMGIVGKYPVLFANGIGLRYLTPYEGVVTDIGYEIWATTCHVHAEVQLAVYYDLREQAMQSSTDEEMVRPRCIGISKWLCFLCWEFLKAHGKWFPSKTHGRLYDQWTIPDLVEYGDGIRDKYVGIVNVVDEGVRERAEAMEGRKELWRVEPMTSRQDLLFLQSGTGNGNDDMA